MSKNHALIISECFSDNLGDQAISDAMLQALRDKGYFVEKVDFTCRPQKNQNTPPRLSNNRLCLNIWRRLRLFVGFFWAIKNLPNIREVARKKYDLVVIGGGQLILDNSKFPIALYLWIKLLKKNNTNINILSCGVGESFCWIERILIKKALNLTKEIYLRDIRSIVNAKRNFGVNAKFCPDISYYLSKKIATKHNNNLINIMGVNVVDYRIYTRHSVEMSISPLTESEYINQWTNNIVAYIEEGTEVALLSTTDADQTYAEKVFLKIQAIYGDRISLYPKSKNWNNFCIQLSHCNIFLSGRMHGLILAHICGLKTIPYLVNKKVETLSNEYLNTPIDLILINIDLILNEITGLPKLK
jgi:polysaccharide pyruvyl transferase WcaK-like protein